MLEEDLYVLTTKRFGLKKLSYRKWVWVLALLPLCLCACVCVRCLCFVLSPDGFVLSLRGWCQERLLCFSGEKKIWTLTLIDRSNGQKHLWKPCVQMFLCQFVLTLTYTFRTASCRTCMWTNDEDLEVVKKNYTALNAILLLKMIILIINEY